MSFDAVIDASINSDSVVAIVTAWSRVTPGSFVDFLLTTPSLSIMLSQRNRVIWGRIFASSRIPLDSSLHVAGVVRYRRCKPGVDIGIGIDALEAFLLHLLVRAALIPSIWAVLQSVKIALNASESRLDLMKSVDHFCLLCAEGPYGCKDSLQFVCLLSRFRDVPPLRPQDGS